MRNARHTRVDRGFADIPNGCTFDHVPNGKALDGLVLWNASRAVRAADKGDVTAALLVSAAVSSLLSLDMGGRKGSKLVTSSSAIGVHPSQPNERDRI